MKPPIDPRDGDIEADASSTKSRSLTSLAGSLLVEVSLPKLAVALVLLIVVPGVLLGLAPLFVTLWLHTVRSTPGLGGIWAAVVVVALVVVAWLGGRRLFRIVEDSFWSLNALAVQPSYAACREVIIHLADRFISVDTSATKRARIRAAAAVAAGLVIVALALLVIALLWPATRWVFNLADLTSPLRLAPVGIANSIVIVAAYLAGAAIVWGIADAIMPEAKAVRSFAARRAVGRTWRIAHLSDVHVVGERYGFRLGSGRTGPRGNERFLSALARLEDVHRTEPLDAILITGDLTDAGTSAEWAELLDALDSHPTLTDLVVAMPGNHDVNVVDRANPARLELPTSPKKRLRQMRTISVLAAMQGTRVHVPDSRTHQPADTLAAALGPRAAEMAAFADRGTRRLSKPLRHLWESCFPLVQLPDTDDGLGIIVLNSNAETHFSFTNALGIVSLEQVRAMDAAMAQYPRAFWIVSLHHHIVEFPAPGSALGERIGTTLINGTWFTRRLQRMASRVIVMHGHRHIDWIGECGGLTIVSAPSTVLGGSGSKETSFSVHTLGVDAVGRLTLLEPARIVVCAG